MPSFCNAVVCAQGFCISSVLSKVPDGAFRMSGEEKSLQFLCSTLQCLCMEIVWKQGVRESVLFALFVSCCTCFSLCVQNVCQKTFFSTKFKLSSSLLFQPKNVWFFVCPQGPPSQRFHQVMMLFMMVGTAGHGNSNCCKHTR